jgi:hypothetical protein
MKSKLSGIITSLKKEGGNTVISLTSSGKVDTANISAQEISFEGILKLKTIIANQMKIGAVISINITDEKTDEGTI